MTTSFSKLHYSNCKIYYGIAILLHVSATTHVHGHISSRSYYSIWTEDYIWRGHNYSDICEMDAAKPLLLSEGVSAAYRLLYEDVCPQQKKSTGRNDQSGLARVLWVL